MNCKYKTGEVIKCLNTPVKIIRWLAEGGQGDVYIVEQNGIQKAMKWYKPNGMGKDPKAFYENIKRNFLNGSPDNRIFLWPEDITEWKDGTFGYIMPIRPEGFYEISEYLLANVRFTSMRVIVDAALNIINAFRILHNNGYCYQDLNDGNFFINPKNGAVLICDNDNVSPDGTHTGIVGKPGFIAPEIILGANQSRPKMPDTYSDRFSMSIVLFMIFCATRPLEGRRTFGDAPRTEALMQKVYGSDPHFIMENVNHPQYGPDPVCQKNVFKFWNALPNYMKDLFLKSFSQKSINTPGARPKELDWLQCLVRFRSELLMCSCGAETAYEEGKTIKCEKCGKIFNIPYKLTFERDNYSIPGVSDSRIYRCQLGACNANEALSPVGRILENKSNPGQFGIRNLTNKYWDAETPSGKSKKVKPNDIVPLKGGIKLVIESEKLTINENGGQ